MMRALLTIPLVLAVVTVASASSVPLSTAGTLGAATASTSPCTTAPLSVVPVMTGNTIGFVTVGGVPTACAGGTLQVGVTSGGTSGSGSMLVPAGGGTLVVAISTPPTLGTLTASSAVIVGP